MTEGTHKLSYIQLKDKVKGHGAKFKGIYKFISMNNYNRYIYLTVKASSHIDDTTRHDSMRHDPFFRSPYNQMDQFTHMQHDNRFGSDFCRVSQRQYQENC